MRTKKITISCLCIALISSGILVSCEKKVSSKSKTTESSNNNLVSLQAMMNADDALQLEYSTDPSSVTSDFSGPVPICAPIITYDNPPGVYPRTETRDWGTGCENQGSGQVRSGKLFTYFSGDMNVVGSYYIQEYENYYIDGVHIEGRAKVVHVQRKSGDPQNVYNQVAKNRKLTQPNGDYIIYNGSKRLVKWEDDGEQVVYLKRGYFKLTGVTTGDAMEGGVSYQFRDSIDSENPIIYKHCDFIIKGKEIYDFTNKSAWFVDYGPNVCDDQAEVTIDGVTTTITLPVEP